MDWVRAILFNTQQPLWRYCLIMFPLALVPSLLLAGTAHLVVSVLGLDLRNAPELQLTPLSIVEALLLAPATETLLLALLLFILSKLVQRTFLRAGLSALLWALFHGAFGGFWFFGVIWNFFIFSCAYLAWRPRSFAHGYVAAAVPHALVNAAAILLLMALRYG